MLDYTKHWDLPVPPAPPAPATFFTNPQGRGPPRGQVIPRRADQATAAKVCWADKHALNWHSRRISHHAQARQLSSCAAWSSRSHISMPPAPRRRRRRRHSGRRRSRRTGRSLGSRRPGQSLGSLASRRREPRQPRKPKVARRRPLPWRSCPSTGRKDKEALRCRSSHSCRRPVRGPRRPAPSARPSAGLLGGRTSKSAPSHASRLGVACSGCQACQPARNQARRRSRT